MAAGPGTTKVAKGLRVCQSDYRTMETKTAILSIDGLSEKDFPALTNALQAVPGVSNVSFSVERSVAVLDFDPSQSHIDDFLRAVLRAGFRVL